MRSASVQLVKCARRRCRSGSGRCKGGQSWSRRVEGCKACGVQVVLEAFLIDGKLIRSELITPDVIVNKRGPGTKKSSVKGKEAAIAGGRTCERSQAAHL